MWLCVSMCVCVSVPGASGSLDLPWVGPPVGGWLIQGHRVDVNCKLALTQRLRSEGVWDACRAGQPRKGEEVTYWKETVPRRGAGSSPPGLHLETTCQDGLPWTSGGAERMRAQLWGVGEARC